MVFSSYILEGSDTHLCLAPYFSASFSLHFCPLTPTLQLSAYPVDLSQLSIKISVLEKWAGCPLMLAPDLPLKKITYLPKLGNMMDYLALFCMYIHQVRLVCDFFFSLCCLHVTTVGLCLFFLVKWKSFPFFSLLLTSLNRMRTTYLNVSELSHEIIYTRGLPREY